MSPLRVNNPRMLAVLAAALAAACSPQKSEPASDEAQAPSATIATPSRQSCAAPGIRDVVERFGEHLKDVSLLAPDSVLRGEIRTAYTPYVTAFLLSEWVLVPKSAPGREVSSPWPDRIEIDSVTERGTDECEVSANVVYVSSSPTGGLSARERVRIGVMRSTPARISSFDTSAVVRHPAPSVRKPDTAEAKDAVRAYYDAINERDFRRAYRMWEGDGAASKQTFDQFAGGFAKTERSTVEIAGPVRIEGAAGSRYAEVPVRIQAATTGGGNRLFHGSYTLRRSVVDGASAEQRRWHIYSASMRPAPPMHVP